MPSDAGSYTVTPEAASVSPGTSSNYSSIYNGTSYTINQAASVLSLAAATVRYGDTLNVTTLLTNGAGTGAITYDITSGAACAITSSTTLTVTNASGTCTLRGQKAADTNYSANSATATITFATRLITVKSNNASKVTNATEPNLNGYSITSGTLYGSDTITVTGSRTTPNEVIGTYDITPSVTFTPTGLSDSYTVTLETGTITISSASLTARTISVTDPGAKTFGGGNFTLTSTTDNGSDSDGTKSYSGSTDSICTLTSGGVVTIVAAGTCTVSVTISAGTTNAAATSSSRNITINKATQTITFTQPSSLANGSSQSLSASASSGLTVTITSNDTGKCTVSGTTVTGQSVGTCSLTASQGGNGNYDPATDVTRTFEITAPGRSKSSQTISLAGATIRNGVAHTMSATGYSGTGAITYSLNSGSWIGNRNSSSGQRG